MKPLQWIKSKLKWRTPKEQFEEGFQFGAIIKDTNAEIKIVKERFNFIIQRMEIREEKIYDALEKILLEIKDIKKDMVSTDVSYKKAERIEEIIFTTLLKDTLKFIYLNREVISSDVAIAFKITIPSATERIKRLLRLKYIERVFGKSYLLTDSGKKVIEGDLDEEDVL